jgi:hypothetical protein
MPKKIPEPSIEYEQVSSPDTVAVEAAFDLLFELMIASNEAEGGSLNRGGKLE